MESLQLAQILADLSSLNAAEPQAADALLKANKELRKAEGLPAPPTSVPSKRLELADLKRTSSASRTASPAKFDKYGRRILMSPPLSRTNSGQGSHPGTPRRESDAEDEVDRASTLMALYEIRSKLKQQDNSSLLKAREKISALAARQQAEVDKIKGPAGAASTTAGASSAPTTKHYPYTYPK